MSVPSPRCRSSSSIACLALAVQIELDRGVDDLCLSQPVLAIRERPLDLRLGHGHGARAQRWPVSLAARARALKAATSRHKLSAFASAALIIERWSPATTRAKPRREWIQRRCRRHELIAIARHREQLKRRRVVEPRRPLVAKGPDEVLVRGHISQLRLQEREKAGLDQAVTWRPEERQMLYPRYQGGVVEQRALHDQPAHAVRHEHERSVLRKRRYIEARAQVKRENRQIRIGRPHAADVRQQTGAITEAKYVPVAQRRYRSRSASGTAPTCPADRR